MFISGRTSQNTAVTLGPVMTVMFLFFVMPFVAMYWFTKQLVLMGIFAYRYIQRTRTARAARREEETTA